MEFKNDKRPDWCPHKDCQFLMTNQNLMCSGRLPEPEPHGEDVNTHRWCLNEQEFGKGVHDLQVNKTDVWYFKRHMETIMKDCEEIKNKANE